MDNRMGVSNRLALVFFKRRHHFGFSNSGLVEAIKVKTESLILQRKMVFGFLGPNVPIDKSFFRIPRISATLAGFWPQTQRSWFTVLLFWLNCFAVALGAFGENIYGFLYMMTNLVAALKALCPGVTKMISFLKMLSFFTYQQRWLTIVERMRQMIATNLVSDTDTRIARQPQKLKMLESLASVASILSFILLAAGSSTNASFNLMPLVTATLKMWRGEEAQRMLPFNIAIPDIFVEYPLYPATYAMLTLSGAMTVFTFSAVDGFFLCFCMYTCGLFRMIQHDIREAFAELKTCERATFNQNISIRQQLTAIVVRHNAIINLCTDFTKQFTIIIMMHFLSAALVVCLSILDLMLSSASFGIVIYIFYSIAALMQLLLYCLGGEYVRESSLEVASTLYDVEWYKCDAQTRKMILMILRRAQKPKSIRVPFFTPSLSAFSSIISTAGSYITLLKTFL